MYMRVCMCSEFCIRIKDVAVIVQWQENRNQRQFFRNLEIRRVVPLELALKSIQNHFVFSNSFSFYP